MDILEIILGALTIAAAAGGVSAWYKKSQGKDALDLAQRINEMLKEENSLLVRKNTALQAQLDTKDQIIERLTRNG